MRRSDRSQFGRCSRALRVERENAGMATAGLRKAMSPFERRWSGFLSRDSFRARCTRGLPSCPI